jgi:hypothetical protein
MKCISLMDSSCAVSFAIVKSRSVHHDALSLLSSSAEEGKKPLPNMSRLEAFEQPCGSIFGNDQIIVLIA